MRFFPVKTLEVITSPNTEAHATGCIALWSFLRLLTVSGRLPASELPGTQRAEPVQQGKTVGKAAGPVSILV